VGKYKFGTWEDVVKIKLILGASLLLLVSVQVNASSIDGILYGGGSGTFYTVDTNTGDQTLIGFGSWVGEY
jgi:hypothetical protein